MTDDDLLRHTGDAMRDPDLLDDARWDRLAAHQLHGEERAELEALAAQSELGQEALAAFAPLGDEAHGRLEALFGAREETAAAPAPEVAPAPASEVARSPGPANVFSLDAARQRRRRWVAGGATVLAAAAVAWMTLRPVAVEAPAGDLVSYRLQVEGGDKVFRSPDTPVDELRRLAPDSLLALRLIPARAADAPVAAQAWWVSEGQAQELAVDWEITPSGGIGVETRAAALFGARRGQGELILAVRPASLDPAANPEAARASGHRMLRGWFDLID